MDVTTTPAKKVEYRSESEARRPGTPQARRHGKDDTIVNVEDSSDVLAAAHGRAQSATTADHGYFTPDPSVTSFLGPIGQELVDVKAQRAFLDSAIREGLRYGIDITKLQAKKTLAAATISTFSYVSTADPATAKEAQAVNDALDEYAMLLRRPADSLFVPGDSWVGLAFLPFTGAALLLLDSADFPCGSACACAGIAADADFAGVLTCQAALHLFLNVRVIIIRGHDGLARLRPQQWLRGGSLAFHGTHARHSSGRAFFFASDFGSAASTTRTRARTPGIRFFASQEHFKETVFLYSQVAKRFFRGVLEKLCRRRGRTFFSRIREGVWQEGEDVFLVT